MDAPLTLDAAIALIHERSRRLCACVALASMIFLDSAQDAPADEADCATRIARDLRTLAEAVSAIGGGVRG